MESGNMSADSEISTKWCRFEKKVLIYII